MADDNKDKYIIVTEQVVPPILVSAPLISNNKQQISINFDMNEVTPEILRSSNTSYKAAAINATDVEVLFIRPNQISKMPFQALYHETAAEIMGNNKNPQKTAEIINNFQENKIPRIKEINYNIKNFIDLGAAAEFMGDVCVINEPSTPEEEKNRTTSDLIAMFQNTYIKDIPGEYKDWQLLMGAHEGEHCNQGDIKINVDDSLSRLKVGILQETLSDRHAFDVLKKMGKDDVIQTWKDYRAINAIYGTRHATNIFLDQENSPEEITDLQVIAAQTFNSIAISTVSHALNISDKDAADMQSKYPKEFTKILKEEMKNTHIVSGHTPENKENEKTPKENPYVLQYISQYIDAVDRRLGDDKTPYKPYPQKEKNESATNLEERKIIAKELGIAPADIDKQQQLINITEPSDPAEKSSMNLHGQSAPAYFNAHASVTEYPEESLKIAIAKPNIQQQATFTV